MKLGIDGKLALVTGGSGGIGGAIASALAKEGAHVIVHGRDELRANAVVESIIAEGGKAYSILGQLDTDTGAEQVLSELKQRFGGVDILVNNAGAFEVCPWWEGSAERWQNTLNHTVVTMVRMIRGLVPVMRERGWGRVIQVSSVAATLAPPLFPDYAAAKAAVLNVTVTLAKELAGSGVTVNTVSPGPVVTRTWEAFARQIAALNGWPDDIEVIKEKLLSGFLANPSGRLGQPEDIAHAVSFLSAQQSDFINGVNLRVEGGLNATVG